MFACRGPLNKNWAAKLEKVDISTFISKRFFQFERKKNFGIIFPLTWLLEAYKKDLKCWRKVVTEIFTLIMSILILEISDELNV
jgi:hypothetical protein